MNLAVYGKRNGKIDIAAFALIDDDAPETVWQFRWHFDSKGYVIATDRSSGNKTTLRLHRLICGLGVGDSRQVDHMNGDPSDNRKVNLRIVTPAQNAQNHRGHTGASSSYRGVSFDKARQKWHAYCRVDRHLKHFGFYATEEEAAQVIAEKRAVLLPFSIEGR